MHIPEKFEVSSGELTLDQNARAPWKQGHKLKLVQNLCGLKDAGATWFEHLESGVLARGFTQSEVDPCLFCKKDSILIACVDDCVPFSPKSSSIDDFITDAKKDCALEDEGDVHACPGMNVTRPTENSIQLNQPALTKRIVDSVALEDQRVHDTLADKVSRKDSGGPPRESDFHC